MRRNIFALGNRSLNGSFDRILLAGDLNMEDSSVKSLYGAGDIDIRNSTIRKGRAAGNMNAANCSFGNFKAAGDVNMTGICKADFFVVVGGLRAEYLECRVLRHYMIKEKKNMNGMPSVIEFKGSFKAQTFENMYPFRLNCDFDFKNIISKSELIYDGVLECERLYSFAAVKMEGVNAEFIYMKPHDDSKIESVMGTHIVISEKWRPDKEFRMIPKSVPASHYHALPELPDSIMTLSEIEGDKIHIDNVKADLVRGIDVEIGDLCVVERVEYKSGIKISDKAIVNEVIKQ